MKRIILIFAIFFNFALIVKAQSKDINNEVASIFSNKKTEIDWKGLFTLTFHQKISNVKPGIAIETLINQNLILGVFGQFTSGNFALPFNEFQNNIITQDFGIIIGATENINKLFHLSGQIRIGVILMQADSSHSISLSKPFNSTSNDNGITIYPELNANLNLTYFLKLRAGLGFNFLMLNKESVVKERDLDTWFFTTALIINLNK